MLFFSYKGRNIVTLDFMKRTLKICYARYNAILHVKDLQFQKYTYKNIHCLLSSCNNENYYFLKVLFPTFVNMIQYMLSLINSMYSSIKNAVGVCINSSRLFKTLIIVVIH